VPAEPTGGRIVDPGNLKVDALMRMQDWMKAGFALWALSGEMAVVITLRSMMMAGGGPKAAAEMQRMMAEKIAAGLALQAVAWRGGLGTTTPAVLERSARYYERRVRANRRRLSKV
jgi:hypothetical protein